MSNGKSIVVLLILGWSPMALAQRNPFLGKWNIAGQPPQSRYVYWLEVKEDGGKLGAMFLNRGGSPVPAENVKLEETGSPSAFLPARDGPRRRSN